MSLKLIKNMKYSLQIITILLLAATPFALLIAQSKINKDSLYFAKHQYKDLRYVEDFSYLKDTALRTEGLDKLKFIPLSTNKTSYLTLGDESRLRFEYYHNEGLSDKPYQDNGYFQQRTMLFADVHAGNHFRLFTQLTSGSTSCRKGGVRPVVDRDDLDFNQLFLDIKFNSKTTTYFLRTGRQELFFGTGKFFEPREGPNSRLTFKSVRFNAQNSKIKIDAFVAQPILTKPNYFDNAPITNTITWGLYSTWNINQKSRIGIDLYYFGIRNKTAFFEKGIGEELRHTLGFRFFGFYKKLEYEAENFVQFGSFANNDIAAWGSTLSFSYTLPKALNNTQIGIGGALNTGDKGAGSNKLGTFNAMFPTGFYFGPPAVILGPANIEGLRLSLNTALRRNIYFISSWVFFWRQNINDALYTPNGFIYRPSAGSKEKYVGNQLNLIVAWQINNHIKLVPVLALFAPGDFLKASAAKSVTYFSTDLTFKF